MKIQIPRQDLSDFCRRRKISELSLFGSVLRDDFGPDSDIDILVRFEPDSTPTLFDLATMEDELSHIFGRKIDLISRNGIEFSRNHLRRRQILESAKVIYAA